MNVGVVPTRHGNEESTWRIPKAMYDDPNLGEHIKVLPASYLAMTHSVRQIDVDLSKVYPHGSQNKGLYEGDYALELYQACRIPDSAKTPFDVLLEIHNCNFRNGGRVMIAPDWHDGFRVSRHLLAIAEFFGYHRVFFHEDIFYKMHDSVIGLEIPHCNSEHAWRRQTKMWCRKIGALATHSIEELPAVDLSKFHFYIPYDIPRQQAEALDLARIQVTRAFQRLPDSIVESLNINPPGYAVCWGENFSIRDPDGVPSHFGTVCSPSIFNYMVRSADWPNDSLLV